jgi:hypothetical protein
MSRKRANGSDYSAGLSVAESYERCIVGSLLENPALWKELEPVTPDHFFSTYTRVTMTAIESIVAQGQTVDLASVVAEVSDKVPPGYIAECRDGILPENFPSYKRRVLDAAKDRRYHAQLDVLGTLTDPAERLAKLQEMQDTLANGDAGDWQSLFHSREEFISATPLEFRINNFLQDSGITIIGGLSGHGKTLIMLAMAKALLTGKSLFDYDLFSVPAPVKRVVYLVPESALGPFWSRIKMFRLEEFAGNGPDSRLLVQTLNAREKVSLSDARLLKAVEGADVFLDTAVRFMDGSENDVEGTRPFADDLFRLLSAGARSICGAHHSPKGFANAEWMTLENILRGSGDIGAMLCTAWGIRQIDPTTNRIFVENCKPRDFQPCEPFIIEGRPHLDDDGNFKMIANPGDAGDLKQYLPSRNGRPESTDKASLLPRALELRQQGMSIGEIAKAIGKSKSTVQTWFDKSDLGE